MIEFEAADFHHAFGRAAKIANRNAGGAGNAFGVNIEGVDDLAMFAATDRTSMIEVSVPCKATVPTSFTLPHHIIAKVVGRAKGTIAFEPVESKRGPAVQVVIDGREIGDISVIDEPWHMVMPSIDWNAAIEFDGLADALGQVAWATLPNSVSPMTRSVHLVEGRLQATDANRLAEAAVSYAGPEALIDVGPLVDALAKAKQVRLAVDGKLLHLGIDAATHFVTPLVTGVKYPEFQNIFTLGTGALFTVSRSGLTESLETVTAVFDRDGEPWAVLEADGDTLTVSFAGEHGELFEELEIYNFEGDPFRIGIATSYLSAALGGSDADEITIDIASTVKGLSMMRISDGYGYRSAITTRRPD